MTYHVKELYFTLQGEGARTGRPAVFCRFAGCNLWSGREDDRRDAVCRFCDTDFIGTDGPGGGTFATAGELAEHAQKAWRKSADSAPYIVFTGGEPLLQLDKALIDACHDAGFEVAIETNGTLAAPDGIDWICVSPKADAELVLDHGNELKLVYPQKGGTPDRYENLDFEVFYLQPMDGPARDENTQAAVNYCLEHPKWRLSLQTHKFLGIP